MRGKQRGFKRLELVLRYADLRVDALFRHINAAKHLQLVELNVEAVTKRFGIVEGEVFIKRNCGARLGFRQHARLQFLVRNSVM
ncbi:hypothetical protein D3C80_889590 [compost metagenome]